MSYCKERGKDKIIFVTKEDHQKPSTVQLPEDDEPRGLILPNGEINWNCPCLGGMASGPCGVQFREAFSCFHHSTSENKGSDCLEKFVSMHECMSKYPNVYPQGRDDEDEMDFQKMVDEDDKKQGSIGAATDLESIEDNESSQKETSKVKS